MKKIVKLKIDEKIQEWNEAHPEHTPLDRYNLAEIVDVSYNTIYNLTREDYMKKNLQVVYHICQVLKCTFEELIETIEE